MPRRAKAVRRPKPRPRAEQGPANEAVRERYANPFALLRLNAENFYRELPTPAERRAYAEVYPERFFYLFGFFGNPMLSLPAVVGYGFPFRRDEFLDFFAEHPPREPFDPPDLRGVAYCDHEAAMCAARAAWWKANRWPMTDAERAWRDPRGTLAAASGGNILTMKGDNQ